MDPPSDRVPEQGPDCFLVATEACGGGTPDLCFFLGVSEFIGIYGGGIASVGPTRRSQACLPPLGGGGGDGVRACDSLVAHLAFFQSFWGLFWSKTIIVKFHSIWTPSENGPKTRKKHKQALGTELIG